MARARGISGGGSKADLISDLLRAADTSASSVSQPASAASAQQPASAPQAAVAAAPAGEEAQGLEKRLLATPLAALRAIARQKGLRGNTKEELVAALVAATPSLPSSVPVASASASAPSAYPAASAPLQSNASAPTFVPARAAAPAAKPSPATLVAEAPAPAPFTLPFQSEFSTTLTPVQAIQLQEELASLREAMAALQADQKVISADREGLREQAGFLRNLLIGGIGLAAATVALAYGVHAASHLLHFHRYVVVVLILCFAGSCFLAFASHRSLTLLGPLLALAAGSSSSPGACS
ncbi:unnamed protein product [Closterium sp. Yama58-4]|nr:unnamed protein product [Closterium sp. Yama58-4]